jgi:hypothetical protein
VDRNQVKDGNSPAIKEGQRVIREHWGEETPRVLDMFAGSGAIQRGATPEIEVD